MPLGTTALRLRGCKYKVEAAVFRPERVEENGLNYKDELTR